MMYQTKINNSRYHTLQRTVIHIHKHFERFTPLKQIIDYRSENCRNHT
jgi:hypothetical protein